MRNFAVSLLSLTVLASGAMAAGLLSAQAAPSSQVVSMRRLTQAEYRNSIADIFGKESKVGCVVIVAITIVIAIALWIISRRTAVTAKDLDRTHVTPEQEAEGAFEREPAPAVV